MLCADLNWLPHSLFKGITYPTVVLEEEEKEQSYSGYYTPGTGIITVVPTSTVASTIAHEFRHYLQDLNGICVGSNFQEGNSYEEAIREYFLTQPTEMDALLFEFSYAKDWCNDWWLRKLVLNQ